MRTDDQAAKCIQRRKHSLSAITFAMLLAIVPDLPKAQEIMLTLVTVRDDQNHPVYSEIVQIPPKVPEEALPLNETDRETGDLVLNFVCSAGTRIQAQPYSLAYHNSRKAHCRSTMEFRVEPIHVGLRLQLNLTKAVDAEDYATATLIANELANIETREGFGVSGVEAESLAVVYAATAFGVTDGAVFDRAQGKTVMTAGLKAEVLKYQSQMGLKETGQLDYKTVSALAGTSSGAVRYIAYVPWGSLE